MARALKVYAADIDGLHDWIVAAPNQGEALATLGVNQNLFGQGRARLAEDAQAIAAARASPGVALRRLKGTQDPYRPTGDDGAQAWERAAKEIGAKAPRKRAKPDRSALDQAKAALAIFERAAAEEDEALNREAEAIEARRRAVLHNREGQLKVLRRDIETETRRFHTQG